MKTIDALVGQKFAVAAGLLMTRVFSTPLAANPRRLAFACGPVMGRDVVTRAGPQSSFDVVGMGLRADQEWQGPVEIFVEELRDGEARTWHGCRLWGHEPGSPLYLPTEDPGPVFSYDGWSLVSVEGGMGCEDKGVELALAMLRATARRVPRNLEQHRMM